MVIGAYDTVYCERIAPGEKKKTCRNVGAHRTETKKNGTDFIRSEYSRVYMRLKARKKKGTISVDEWNRAVAQIQDMKAQAQNGAISNMELKTRYDAI